MLISIIATSLLAALAQAQSQTTVSATGPASTSAASASASASSGASRTSSTTANANIATVSGVGTASLSELTGATAIVPTGSYVSYSTTVLLNTSSLLAPSNTTTTARPTNGTITRSSTRTSASFVLSGSNRGTSTVRTSSAALPANTQACNNYVELCNRKYSNITEVCAHNSAFSVQNNLFSNQQVSIPGMLNDGVRMIQGETHWVNNTIYSCHTSCDFLNVGPYENELLQVREWLDEHPYEVVTLLIVNSDYVDVRNYTAAFENSGILKYIYIPPKVPMNIGDWPTLGELILQNKRVIAFMDYMANQGVVPYIVDEFSAMFETPFSPTNASFPCNLQRPPNTPRETAEQKMYLANHNLNVAFSLLGSEVLIPDFANLSEVNGVVGPASLEAMSNTCVNDWGRPPNWLLVDFYNEGTYTVNGAQRNGSVFEVAAQMNNLTYNRPCCGKNMFLTSEGVKQGGHYQNSVFAAVVLVLAMFVM